LGERFLHGASLPKNISFETASHLSVNSETRLGKPASDNIIFKKYLASLSSFVLKALRDRDKQWLFRNSRGERFGLMSELDSGRVILKMSTQIPKEYEYSDMSRGCEVTEYNSLVAEY
jgi:hypothetical protein